MTFSWCWFEFGVSSKVSDGDGHRGDAGKTGGQLDKG
jgi:hypothetical protein